MTDPAEFTGPVIAPFDGTGPWEFASPSIRFGEGRVAEVGEVARPFGRSARLVTGRRSDAPAVRAVVASLESAGMSVVRLAAADGEPTVDQVVAGLRAVAFGSEDDVIVAVGGGSAIDLAKAVAALATNGLDAIDRDSPGVDERLDAFVVDHLEGVGRGLPIRRPPMPVVAVPTTAGTGAEATRNAVISCPVRRFKKSLRSPLMVPRAAVVDPLLTTGCPREVAAACGIDCITQLIESYVCRFRRPLLRGLVREVLPEAMRGLPLVVRWAGVSDVPPEVGRARAAMSQAAMVSGIALSNSGLGLAHGVAAAIGIECGLAHGVACGLLIPVAMEVNRRVAAADFAELERLLDPGCPADVPRAAGRFVERIVTTCRDAGMPRSLCEVGLARDRLDWLAENSLGGSMRGNPVALAPRELRDALAAAYDQRD